MPQIDHPAALWVCTHMYPAYIGIFHVSYTFKMSLFFNSGSLNNTAQGPKSAAKVNNNWKIQLRFCNIISWSVSNIQKITDFFQKQELFLKKVNKQLKSADIFSNYWCNKKIVLNKNASKFSEKSKTTIFNALSW